MKKAIIFLRNSSEFKMFNNEAERELRDFVGTIPNTEVVRVHIDMYDGDYKKPSFDILSKLIESAKNGEFELIVTNDFHGLISDCHNSWCLIDEFNKLGVNIISESSKIIDNQKEFKLMRIALNELYLEEHREKLAKARRRKAESIARACVVK